MTDNRKIHDNEKRVYATWAADMKASRGNPDFEVSLQNETAYWKKEKVLQAALVSYVRENNLYVSPSIEFEAIIDAVVVYMEDKPVLIVGLPPVSQYSVRETQYTRNVMNPEKLLAV